MTSQNILRRILDQKRITSSNAPKLFTASARIDLNKNTLINNFNQTTI